MGTVVKALVGRKVGMTQVFTEGGEALAVTVIRAGPCTVVEQRTPERNGYSGVQVAFEPIQEPRLTKPERGHLAKAGVAPHRVLREFRFADPAALTPGATLTVEQFAVGDRVSVAGTSKGRGFTGTIKRFNQHRGRMTHGSMSHRRPASTGATTPNRVWRGTHKPGPMGNERVTTRRLEVVGVRPAEHVLLLRGAVAGPNGGLVLVTQPTPPKDRRKSVRVVDLPKETRRA